MSTGAGGRLGGTLSKQSLQTQTRIRGAAGQEELAWSEPCSGQTRPAPRTLDAPASGRDVAAALLQQQLQMAVSSAACYLQRVICSVSSVARTSCGGEMKPPRPSIAAARGRRGSSTQSHPPAPAAGLQLQAPGARPAPAPAPAPCSSQGPRSPRPAPAAAGRAAAWAVPGHLDGFAFWHFLSRIMEEIFTPAFEIIHRR